MSFQMLQTFEPLRAADHRAGVMFSRTSMLIAAVATAVAITIVGIASMTIAIGTRDAINSPSHTGRDG